MEGKPLGGGVVLYEGAIDLDWDALREFAKESGDKERGIMYTPGKDPITGEQGFINRNGYFYPTDSIDIMPLHCAFIHQDHRPDVRAMLATMESAKDECLLEYLHRYPIAGKCIWWKIKGHFLVYPPGAYLGSHADTSTDYSYGSPHPTHQIATRTVVSTLTFVNDHVETDEELDGTNYTGGVVNFEYLGIQHAPRRGDILVFPSNYMAAHDVSLVGGGPRYAHVGWYCHGTPNAEVHESVLDPLENPEQEATATNVYMTEGYSIL